MRPIEITKNVVGYTAAVVSLYCIGNGLWLDIGGPISEARNDVVDVQQQAPPRPSYPDQLPDARKQDIELGYTEQLLDHAEDVQRKQDALIALTDKRFDWFTYAVAAGIVSCAPLVGRGRSQTNPKLNKKGKD